MSDFNESFERLLTESQQRSRLLVQLSSPEKLFPDTDFRSELELLEERTQLDSV